MDGGASGGAAGLVGGVTAALDGLARHDPARLVASPDATLRPVLAIAAQVMPAKEQPSCIFTGSNTLIQVELTWHRFYAEIAGVPESLDDASGYRVLSIQR
jgi:hypothetical protein